MSEPIHPEFEAHITEDPNETTNYAVYADWLQKQGSPRGELMAIQCELDRLRGREKEFNAANREFLYGDLKESVIDYSDPDSYRYFTTDPSVSFEWHCGFIRRAYISAEPGWREPEERLADFCRRVLSLPSARFLQDVSIYTGGTVPAEQHATISRLLLPFAPTLERVHVSTNPTQDFVASFLRDDVVWPRLRTLELFRMEPASVGHICDRAAQLPALRILSVGGQDDTPETLNQLLGSELLQQLETLDLAYGQLGDDDVVAIVEQPEKFAHLKRLNLRGNHLTPPDEILAMPNVICDRQND